MSEAASGPPPPSGDSNSGPAVVAVTATLLAIGILCVLVRCYVRLVMSRNFGWDDAAIVLTLAFLIAGDVFVFKIINEGGGRHLRFLPDPKVAASEVVRWNTYYQIVNITGAWTTKLSISLLLLRIKNDRIFKYIVIGFLVALLIPTMISVITVAVQCKPLEKHWKPDIKGHCISEDTPIITFYVQSGFAIVTDLFLTISPIVILWNVRISIRKKLAIWGLMSLGLMATISNALRNAYILVLKASDITHDLIPVLLVADLEFSLGVIAACLPIFMIFFKSDNVPSFSSRYAAKSSRSGSSTHAWEGIQQHLKKGEQSMNISGAHTVSSARFERQASTESEIPLRGLDQGISCKKTYDVSRNAVSDDLIRDGHRF